MAIQPKMRPARSPAKNGDSDRSRTCPSHASAVAATRIGSAQALESSYGPVASGTTRSGTPSTTEQRPTKTGERGDQRIGASGLARGALDLTRLVHRQWPGPHQAHLPLEDIEELGQLIKGELPQEPADSGEPRVTRRLEDRPGPVVEVADLIAHPLRVLDHGTELVHQEAPAVEPGALLAEDDRPAGGELDRERDGQEERERHDEED